VRDHKTQHPVQRRGGKHQPHKTRLSPPIKYVPSPRQPQVAPALRRASQQVITQKGQRQKKIDEDMRTEIIKPILIYLLYYIIPFVILIILLNFFTTIAAVFLVFYIRK
jgi:ATP-dependent Zn protease